MTCCSPPASLTACIKPAGDPQKDTALDRHAPRQGSLFLLPHARNVLIALITLLMINIKQVFAAHSPVRMRQRASTALYASGTSR